MKHSTMALNRHDLRVLRTINGYTQRQVAFLMDRNVTQSYISKLEEGKRVLTTEIQTDLRRVFLLDEQTHLAVRALSDRLKQAEQS